MSAKKKEVPRQRTTGRGFPEDDWENMEHYLDREDYDEALETLREGKRVGARRI